MYIMYMPPQKFDIFAVSIPDSNVQMAVARIMVGADRYLSMQSALEQVKNPPVLLFKNTDLKDAEHHIAKLKALGVGFRVIKTDDGTEDDSIMRDDELPGKPPIRVGKGAKKAPEKPAAEASEIPPPINTLSAMPPVMSVHDAISQHHRHMAHTGANDDKNSGGHAKADGFSGFGSASGGHGGGGGSGIRAGAGLLDALKKSDEKIQKKNRWVSVVMAAAVVALALLFYIKSKDKQYNVKRIEIQSVAGKNGVKHNSANDKPHGDNDGSAENNTHDGNADPGNVPDTHIGPPDHAQRAAVNTKQRQQANNYLDSAKTGGTPLEKQIGFYKTAIYFNRYNLPAWHGLLNAYREMNDMKEFRAAEEQMKEIFGEEVNSVNNTVAQYGEIVDAYTNSSGTYRVDLKTQKTSRDEVTRDVFNMTRALRNSCKCHDISIHALMSNGDGLIAHSTAETSMHTLGDFKAHADLRWLDE